MWSVATIDYMNREQAAREREWEDEPEPVEVITSREEQIPASEPLATLVARMRRAAPPSVDHLLLIFRQVEGLSYFEHLIDQYLPDMKEEILAKADFRDRMIGFAEAFSDRYFPIYGDGYLEQGDDYTILTNRIPACFEGYRYDDYEEIPNEDDPPLVVVAYILENPYDDSDRAAFAEAAAKYLPKRTLERIPEKGFEFETAETALKGTPFEPVIFWTKVIQKETENEFFDCGDINTDGIDYEVVWNRPTVDALTRKWQEYEEKRGEWFEFIQWFEKDLKKKAADLIGLLERIENAEEPQTFRDVFDDWKDPGSNPEQGKLLNLETDISPVGGAAGTPDTAG